MSDYIDLNNGFIRGLFNIFLPKETFVSKNNVSKNNVVITLNYVFYYA